MLVYYSVTEMGCFGDYLDAAPRAKIMRVNGITTFLLHVSQCITFCHYTNIQLKQAIGLILSHFQ